MGSILAPNAVFDTGFNVDGNIVAKEVTIGSENHRWDWMMPAYPVVPNLQRICLTHCSHKRIKYSQKHPLWTKF